MQADLDAAVSGIRAPHLEDCHRLPYTNAVPHEIQHFINVLPLELPHSLTHNVHLRGHFLPKVPTETRGVCAGTGEGLLMKMSRHEHSQYSHNPGTKKGGLLCQELLKWGFR